MRFRNQLILMIILVLAAGSSVGAGPLEDAWTLLVFYRQEEVDDRMEVFEVGLEFEEDKIIITGEVSSPKSVQPLQAELEEEFPEYRVIDNTRLFSGTGFALVGEKFVDLLSQPGGENIVTQLIFGDPVHILKQEGDWAEVQGPDLYRGWVRTEHLLKLEDEEFELWREGEFFLVDTASTYLYAGPDPGEEKITELLHGSRLHIKEEQNGWSRVFLPGEKQGWVETSELLDEAERGMADREEIIEVAEKYLGTPYVWAGTHIQGADCSGYVQRVLAFSGIYYPRDSDQQYDFSQVVKRDELKQGDLVFFSTYRAGPSHLGFYLGDGYYIHAGSQAGRVVIESLDPESEKYNVRLDNNFLSGARLEKNPHFLAPWMNPDIMD